MKAQILALTLFSALCCMSAAQAAARFDPPLSHEHLPLARDPVNPQAEAWLDCIEHPGFVVKQVDRGEVGAERLAIIRLAPRQKAPACTVAPARGERTIPESAGAGYFKGVKGRFVIFEGTDSSNGGSYLIVYDAPGFRKLHEALSVDLDEVELLEGSPANPILRLRYTALHQADCSLRQDEAGCWAVIRRLTGLQGEAPDCAAAYKPQEDALPPERRQEVVAYPSLVEYPVEVLIDPRGRVERKILPGKVSCGLAE